MNPSTARDILIVNGFEVDRLLAGRELELIETVRLAYQAHARGMTSLPHSTFLRFPDNDTDRIIALPAYLGGEFGVAGTKWVSSFPGNLNRGLERASAVLILNSVETGRPEAIIEASIVSAKRTAASAALAAALLLHGERLHRVGVIGCGLINFETVRFLSAIFTGIEELILFDLDPRRADAFRSICGDLFDNVSMARNADEVLGSCPLISFATTASRPHISNIDSCVSGTVILHTSLRDLAREVILRCDNVVDDGDHVSRAQTSVHLAEQLVGNRDFIRCTIGEILIGKATARKDPFGITVFSPFGLGILDLAVGKVVCRLASEQNVGSTISSFFPPPWTERQPGNGTCE